LNRAGGARGWAGVGLALKSAREHERAGVEVSVRHRKLALCAFGALIGLALVAVWPEVQRYYRVQM
jgi:hypothetical protein